MLCCLDREQQGDSISSTLPSIAVIHSMQGNPVCPVCRASLYISKSIIPNFALNSLVAKHIEVLASRGVPDWQIDAERRKEWQERKEKWSRITSRKREGEHRRRERAMAYRAERDNIVADRVNRSPVARVRTVLRLDELNNDMLYFEQEGQELEDIGNRSRRVIMRGRPARLGPTDSRVYQNGILLPPPPPQPFIDLTDVRRRRIRGSQVQFD
jgi:hypothetical protein